MEFGDVLERDDEPAEPPPHVSLEGFDESSKGQ